MPSVVDVMKSLRDRLIILKVGMERTSRYNIKMSHKRTLRRTDKMIIMMNKVTTIFLTVESVIQSSYGGSIIGCLHEVRFDNTADVELLLAIVSFVRNDFFVVVSFFLNSKFFDRYFFEPSLSLYAEIFSEL